MSTQNNFYPEETLSVAQEIFEENMSKGIKTYKFLDKQNFKSIKTTKKLNSINSKHKHKISSILNSIKNLSLTSILSIKYFSTYRKHIMFRIIVRYRRLIEEKKLAKGMLDEFKRILNDLEESIDYIKENINEDINTIKELEIYQEAKEIFYKIKQFYVSFSNAIENLHIKQIYNRAKHLKVKEIFNKIRNISLKELFYKLKSFLIKNILLCVKKSKETFFNLKELAIKKFLLFVQKSQETFTKVKNISFKQLSFIVRASKEVLDDLKELTFYEKLGLTKILSYKGITKVHKKQAKLRKDLLVKFIENNISLKDRIIEDAIKLENELNIILSNSKKFQTLKNKIYRIKSFLLSLRERFEEFIMNYKYNHEKTTEYTQRILLVLAIYSLPLLILTKSFYGCVLKVAKSESTRFNWFIPQTHLDLIFKDHAAGYDYIPLKFVPKFLQAVDIDFYIFMSYYTLFGTSKFPLNKELVYHGVLCVAHLVVYVSMGLIMGIFQSIVECTTLALNGHYGVFVLRRFRKLFKPKKFPKTTIILRARQGLSSLTNVPLDELDHFGFCGYDDFLLSVQEGIDLAALTWVLTPMAFYVLITLIYNCCYYILYNKRPHIPIMTKFAKRLTPNVKDD